jgi:hypothetical protein
MDAAASEAISFVALAPDKVELPVTYPASRRKMLMLLGISLLFVAIGIWMLQDPENTLIAGLITGFFGLGALTALVNMHPRASYLTLSERGFEFSSLFRRHFVAWSDVAEFVPISMSGNAMVGFYYAATKQAPAMRHVSNFIAGIEAALPDTYGHSNQELAALMNELRRKFGAKY